MKKKDLFCFFSGYTKGKFQVVDIKKNSSNVEITIFVSKEKEHINAFEAGNYIQLDGVICQITHNNKNTILVSTTPELIQNTSLEHLAIGNSVSLGLLAQDEPTENQDYLLHPSSSFPVTVEDIAIADGHQKTLQIKFSCPGNTNFAQKLAENEHAGIGGSSFMVKGLAYNAKNDRYTFYIHAGRQTQENTDFNNTLKKDTAVNLNLPKSKL